ncbi:NAD-dependent epimerase/dehydratase [Paenibacillus sp. FSL R7-269]|uniref:NAD-dependent epimerase/dehydratase family protein n=1 Tax=Paenibacillus sp. FSL R7-269 TaxID=1226755 RepID=UPI0003E2BA08|nr:NAD-dependent epimerase/dehydratase family protein [Paenibacillus sp. FSL R7-269]ETT50042.1 NAD-dependent epimerase/dehydratase [Paenibacillus sp. FSL R7-269]
MRIVVTGGAGFIGSNIVDELIDLGHRVLIVDNLSTGKKENINKSADFSLIDINSLKLVELFTEFQPEIVIHHAAQVSVSKSLIDPLLDQELNIRGTINLLQACVNSKVKKIIYASSAAVYGTPKYLPINEDHSTLPTSFYGISKFVPESYIKVFSELYGMDYTILRYANVYGPRQDHLGEGGVVSIFINNVLEENSLSIFGDGLQTRDFIFVRDVVSANVAALSKGSEGLFNIGTNTRVSLKELVDIISEVTKKDIVCRNLEPKIGDIKDSCLDNGKANLELQWMPEYSLEKGLRKTFDFYELLKNYNELEGAR